MNVMDTKDNLVRELSQNNKIKGIGQTGDINADLILAIAILTCLFYVLQFQQRPQTFYLSDLCMQGFVRIQSRAYEIP